MRARVMTLVSLLACAIAATPMLAQQDPLSGTWTGDWGPNASDRNQVSVELKWDGKALTGVVKSVRPARGEVSLSNSSFDPATQTVKMEAETQNPRSGQTIKYVIQGKLSGNTLTGSWNHDARTGDFKLTKT